MPAYDNVIGGGSGTARRARRVPSLTAAVLLLAALLLAAAGPATPAAAPGRAPGPAPAAQASPTAGAVPSPRLVVVIVIDQFRADYLDRFRARLGTGGFVRLMEGGTRFTSCAYPYALTETSPGHATIATGTTPDRHGIVSNDWFDRATGRMVLSVDDPGAPVVGAAAAQPGISPRRLLSDTLADGMRLASGGRAKVVGLAVKARAAVLSTGRGATGAFWYDDATGRMVSSRYYGATLPAWVAGFNDRRPADRYFGHDWTVDGKRVVPLGAPGKGSGQTPGRGYYEALPSTPFIHDLLFEFAREAVEREQLGDDEVPDFLFVGLSGHDFLGHEAGPYSPSVAEMTARTDAQIADFLRWLDRRIGPDRYLVALTADHGVGPTMAQGEAGGVGPRDVEPDAVRLAMGRALAARFGAADPIRLLGDSLEVWLDPADLARHRLSIEEAARIAGEGARAVDGVLGYVAASGPTDMDRATVEAYRLSTCSGRSPDLFVVPAPFAAAARLAPANHGTPWTYDTRVPLLFYGPPFRPGTVRAPCTPADIAPTLAAVLGIPPPAMATGRVLDASLR
jgi:hypothetical protein